MINKIRDFMTEQGQALADQAQKLRKEPLEAAREATLKSAAQLKSLNDPIRTLARSGVKLTAISQGTAQSLIELQAQLVTTALTEAAEQLERTARTQNVKDLVRDQADVLRATRDRIVQDITQTVAIFKEAGSDVGKVASETYAKVSTKAKAKSRPAKAKSARKAPKAKRPARKAKTGARKTAR
jgi:phasin family protein